jgi:hypothetical protein
MYEKGVFKGKRVMLTFTTGDLNPFMFRAVLTAISMRLFDLSNAEEREAALNAYALRL